MGMTIALSQVSDSGSMIMGQDDGGKRTLHVIVGGGSGSGDTTITVTYGRKR
jgi:hypothetical protein